MIAYALVILAFFFFFYDLNAFEGNSEPRERAYCIAVGIFLVIIAGLRARTVGADTMGYVYDYSILDSLTFSEVLEKYQKGQGYFFLSKAFSLTGLSVHWWFGLLEVFYVFSFFTFFKRYSDDVLLGILFFVTLGLFHFSLAGLKQILSMSFAALSFERFSRKKYLWAAFLFLMAYWSHNAAAVFLLVLPLYYLRNSKALFPVAAGLCLLAYFGGSWIWPLLLLTFNNENYNEYLNADQSYSNAVMVYYAVLFILAMSGVRRYMDKDSSTARFIIAVSSLCLAFQSMAPIFSISFRLVYYFTPFFAVLLANSCGEDGKFVKAGSKRWLYIAITSFWCIYISRSFQYIPFWME